MAEGLALAGLDVRPSVSVPELGKGAKDAAIVRWCGAQHWVWVTADHDSRSRELRMSLVPAHGARAILLRKQPRGLLEHVKVVVLHYEEWQRVLRANPEPAVWEQPPRGGLRRLSAPPGPSR